MRVPKRLEPLLDQGVIEEVLRPLMSGKEAEVYLVLAEGEVRVAKVYKNAQFRSFQHRAEYTEGRRVRNSREQRAMNKGSRYGRARTEDAWYDAEVTAIQRARAAGVRVPLAYDFTEGVLVMQLVRGMDGEPAPRLVDTHFSPEQATEVFHTLLREVVKMLCAGIVHADLSDFNVLMAADGPVIIDFPQAVDPASNQNASKLLIRDVDNLTSFLGRFAPSLRGTQYGREIWSLYERSELDPDTELTGRFQSKRKKADVRSLLEDIQEVEQEARERREALGLPPSRRARRPIPRDVETVEEAPRRRRRTEVLGNKPLDEPKSPNAGQDDPSEAPKKRRRRRRKRRPEGAPNMAAAQGNRPQQSNRPKPSNGVSGSPEGDGSPPRRRRRRRRRRGGRSGGEGSSQQGSSPRSSE